MVTQEAACLALVTLAVICPWTCAQSTPHYAGVGCFKDRSTPMRSMRLLASYRNPADNSVDWNDLKTSVVDKCAREARKVKLDFFGIQYYGECWGGSDQYDIYGISHNCVWIGGAQVGKEWANYVYMITGEECTNYKTLTSFTRSPTYDILQSRCDSFYYGWIAGWYRFDGAAGKMMAYRCVPYGHCGTQQPGWFNGSLPTVEQGKVSSTVCFNDGTSCCKTNVKILVRYCGGFYVYHFPLSTKGCNKGYCGDGS